MNLRKLFFMFWSCMATGAIVTAATGLIMQWTDPSFGFLGLQAAGFNAGMMALVGTLFGAFSQMGFFAYLTLNYIALSIFRKAYLWNALQAYTTLFAVLFLGYTLFEHRASLNGWLFIVLPAALAAASWAVAVIKVKQTNRTALIPTLFLMFVGTSIEAWPSLSDGGSVAAIVFMVIPLFACNAYQILMLHRILKPAEASSAVNTKPAS